MCFERGEDADKLKRVKTLNVKGVPLTVVTDEVLHFNEMYISAFACRIVVTLSIIALIHTQGDLWRPLTAEKEKLTQQ